MIDSRYRRLCFMACYLWIILPARTISRTDLGDFIFEHVSASASSLLNVLAGEDPLGWTSSPRYFINVFFLTSYFESNIIIFFLECSPTHATFRQPPLSNLGQHYPQIDSCNITFPFASFKINCSSRLFLYYNPITQDGKQQC
jgi:hypothetical protein